MARNKQNDIFPPRLLQRLTDAAESIARRLATQEEQKEETDLKNKQRKSRSGSRLPLPSIPDPFRKPVLKKPSNFHSYSLLEDWRDQPPPVRTPVPNQLTSKGLSEEKDQAKNKMPELMNGLRTLFHPVIENARREYSKRAWESKGEMIKAAMHLKQIERHQAGHSSRLSSAQSRAEEARRAIEDAKAKGRQPTAREKAALTSSRTLVDSLKEETKMFPFQMKEARSRLSDARRRWRQARGEHATSGGLAGFLRGMGSGANNRGWTGIGGFLNKLGGAHSAQSMARMGIPGAQAALTRFGGGLLGGAAGVLGGAAQAATSTRAGDIGGGMGMMAGGAISMLPIPGAPVVGAAVGAFAYALGKGVEKLREFGDKLHQNNMQFAEFSASMSEVKAKQTVRDIELSQIRGERRAESADKLAESRHALNERMAAIEDRWANVQDNAMTQLNKGMINVIDILMPWAARDAEEARKKLGERDDLNTFFVDNMKSKWNDMMGGKDGRPPRFNLPTGG